jgi:hypothetical protein
MIDALSFPNGIRLMQAWQTHDAQAGVRLAEIFDEAVAGRFDSLFAAPAPTDRVHVSGPVDLLALTVMYRLFGVTAEHFYKHDAERFVRASLITQKLIGMSKHYISWPVYGFTAEALGQTMIYSDQYSPGTDPDKPLFNHDNWENVETPDMNSGIPRLLDEVVDCYHRLTGLKPVLHLTAPYSLAADTFGQEAIISALTHEPDFVNRFLDRLADRVLEPWMDHFFERYPGGWVELSDASGSPFFIGPQNCKNVAIRSTQRLKAANPWGDRVYDANYRGDYVTEARATTRASQRRVRRSSDTSEMTLDELFEVKNSVCRDYVIRLAEDRVPVSFYQNQGIRHNIPLFLGIGATQVDRNSIADLASASQQTADFTREYVEAIKRVATAIEANGYESREPPWPGAIYFEDISAESSFELIEVILDTSRQHGELTLAMK